MIDRVSTRQLTLGLVLLVVLAGGLIYAGPTIFASNSTGQAVCDDAFGDGWSYAGYSDSIPPVVHCDGPGGETGLVEMPPEMRDELGIVVVNMTA